MREFVLTIMIYCRKLDDVPLFVPIYDLLIFNEIIAEKNLTSEIPMNSTFKSIYIDDMDEIRREAWNL